MGKEWRMAWVTYSLARATASSTLIPRARPAATAEAKVQPVPWVLVVSMRGAVNSWKRTPS